MDHPLLIDAAVHHLDLTMDLTGARCETVYAQTWRPAWTDEYLRAECRDANLQAVALIFGAIESSRTGQPVRVQELLTRTLAAEGGGSYRAARPRAATIPLTRSISARRSSTATAYGCPPPTNTNHTACTGRRRACSRARA